MKIRKGFVSNSSSSSFVLKKSKLTPLQVELIKNHMEASRYLEYTCKSWQQNPEDSVYSQYDADMSDKWEIRETESELMGHTTMDNFDMNLFFGCIGIPQICEEADYSPPWNIEDENCDIEGQLLFDFEKENDV